MDNQLTTSIQRYLATPQPTEAELLAAAEMLLSVTHDKGLFLRIKANPRRMQSFMDYRLRKILQVRLAGLTMAEVRRMDEEVTPQVADTLSRPHGRRPDHDALPPDIRALWEKNAERWKKLAAWHATLRALTQPCDRFEYLAPMKRTWYDYKRDMARYDDYTATEAV